MQRVLKNYSFNATTGVITLTDYDTIYLEGVKLVANANTNQLIYVFNDPTLGGTVADNTLNLTYDTSAMSNGDALMVVYDDLDETPAAGSDIVGLQDLMQDVRDSLDLMSWLSNARGVTGELRTSVVSGALTTISTVTTVTTVTTVANLASVGGLAAVQHIPATQNQAALASNVTNVTLT